MEISAWQALATALAAPLVTAIFTVFVLRGKRREAEIKIASQNELGKLSLDEKQRERLGVESSRMFDRLRDEASDLRAELKAVRTHRDALEIDRDKGWDLARGWCARAHDLRHELVNCCLAASKEAPTPLPALEEINRIGPPRG